MSDTDALISSDDLLSAGGPQPDPAPQPTPKPPAPTPPQPITSDDLLALDQDRDRLSAATSHGLEQDPARAAKLIALQARTGLPTDLIDRNLDAVTTAVRQKDFDPDAFRKQSPIVAQWLSEDPARVGLTRDDLPSLAATEALIRSSPSYDYRPDGSIVESFPGSNLGAVYANVRDLRDELVKRGVAQDEANDRMKAVQGRLSAFGPLSSVAAGAGLDLLSTAQAIKRLAGRGDEVADVQRSAENLSEASTDLDPGVLGSLGRGVGGLVTQLPLLAIGGPFAEAAQGITKAAAVAKTLEPLLGEAGLAAAQKAVTGAATMQPLALRGAINDDNGTAHALTSWAIDSGIAGAFGPVGAGRFAAKEAGAEVAALEPHLSAAQVLLHHMGMGAGQNIAFDLAHRLHDVASGSDPSALRWDNLLPSLAMSGVLGAGPAALFAAPEAVQRAKEIHDRAGMVGINRMAAAAHGAETLRSIGDTLNGTQAMHLNQDAMGGLIQKLAGDTPYRTLYVDAKAWQEHFDAAQPENPQAKPLSSAREAAAAATGDPLAYDKALASNGQLAVPIEKFVPLLAETAHRDWLTAEARLAPEAMNEREAKEQATTMAERAAIQAEAAGPESPEAKRAASADLVHEDVKRQLVAAGVPESVAEHNASIWRAVAHTAAERGYVSDPLTAYQDFKLRIQRGLAQPMVRSQIDALIERLKAGDIPTEADVERAKTPAAGAVETPTLDAIKELGGIAKTDTAESDDRPKGVRGLDGNLAPDQAAKALAEQGVGDGTVNTLWRLVAQEHESRVNADRSRQESEDSQRIREIRTRLLELIEHFRAIGADVSKESTDSLKAKLLAAQQDRGEALTQEPATSVEGHPVVVADVPYAAGPAKDGRAIYIDRRIPRYLDVQGKRVDVHEAVALHEIREKPRLDAGEPYDGSAHNSALKDEHAFLREKYGIDPAEYEKALRPYIDAARAQADKTLIPTDLDHTPYDAMGERHLIEGTSGQTYAQGGSDPRGTFMPSRLSASGESIITLLKGADRSTFLHETGHALLEFMHDLASKPDAPEAMKADLAKLRDWLGAEGDAPISRAQHEQFARGFERYLMEGKAPAPGLRGAFQRFKQWLKDIYREFSNLHVHLSDDVRQVFDRMLASDDEIAAAQHEAQAGSSLFADQAESGMNDQQWAAYQARVQEGTERAREILEREAMAPLRAEQTKAYQEQREKTRLAVADEVNQRPVYTALLVLQKGAWPEGVEVPDGSERVKLNKSDLVARLGDAGLKLLPGPGEGKANRGRVIYTEHDGISADEAAELFGFRDGGDLVHALLNAPDRTAEIDRVTDERMRETHPDPLMDGSLHEKARAAVDNDPRMEAMEREAAAIARKTGRAATPSELLRAVAKSQIAKLVDKDLRPSLYRVARDRAVRSAAESLAKARAATDPQEKLRLQSEALDHKTNEILQTHLYREATKAAEKAVRNRDYVLSWNDADKRARIGKAGGWEWAVVPPRGTHGQAQAFSADEYGGDPAKAQAAAIDRAKQMPGSDVVRTGYLEQADAIREPFDLSQQSNKALEKRENIRDFIARKEKAGEPISIPREVIDGLGQRNWRELTIGQQQAVVDALKNLEHLAALKNRLLGDQHAQSFMDARDAMVAQIQSTGKARKPLGGPSLADSASDIAGRYFSGMATVARLCREMDGFKDGGVMFDHWLRTMNEAESRKLEMQEDATKRMATLMKEWGKLHTIGGSLPLSLREHEPAIGRSMSHWERIMVALNWGNADNRERLLQGHGWTADQVDRVLAKLDGKDMRFVQGTLDLIDRFWPEIKAKQERVFGVAPEKVEATPIIHGSGIYRGGYFPIAYDPRTIGRDINLDQQADLTRQGARLFASTARGHTEARTGMPDNAQLLLDPGVISRHINNVVHDLAYHETILDLNRYLRDKQFQAAMFSTWGERAFRQFQTRVRDVAAGVQGTNTGIEKLLEWTRQGVNFANRAFNVGSALQQVAGLPGAIVRVGPKYFARALTGMFRNPYDSGNVFSWVDEQSAMMRNRSKTFDKNVSDAMQGVSVRSPVRKILDGAGYYFWTKAFQVLDTHTWLASYMKAMDEHGGDGAKAKAIADQTVADVQGSGATKDLPAAMRGGPLAQVFTSNMSWWLANYNLTAENINRARSGNLSDILTSGSNLFVLYGVQVALWNAVGAAITGKGASEWQNAVNDPGALAASLAKDAAYTGLSSMVLTRDLADVFTGGRYSGPAGLRSMSLIASAIQAIEANRGDNRELKAVAKAAGPLLHLPVAQIVDTAEGIANAQQQGRSPLWAAMFGPARP